MKIQGTPVEIDLCRIPGPHKHIALVPQWDFLELLVAAADKEPTFRLLRSTEVLAPIIRAGTRKDRVIGVSYRDNLGQVRELYAELTVACDGRSSTLRNTMGLRPRNFGAPMDVWWFRLPRNADDPHGLAGVLGAGHACIAIDRGDYFQIAYIIPKGRDAELRAQGIETLHRGVVTLVPWLAGRVEALTSFDDVKLLDVQLNRLRRWYTDGLLLIGDAAHAMSPVGGVGINLAVADAVAAGRTLAGPLRHGTVSTRQLARVQARRWLPAALIQSAQRVIHSRVIAVTVSAGQPARPPLLVRIANRVPALRAAAAYAVAIGPLPEHVPEFARR
jgi:2-polyprenyl-6-methoxyphenol hydroxylase-like FAD-dependent oxidoreductase